MSQIQLVAADEENRGRRRPILEVKNLDVTFTKKQGGLLTKRKVSTVHAVDNVSFDIYESETVSLVGESGSGKTTVARCLLGLMTPNSGSIKFDGTEVTELKGRSLLNYRKDVQLIFQDPFESLNPRQDVFTIVSIPIERLTNERDSVAVTEAVSKLLSEVGLEPQEVLRKFPHQLSGGQRQRVNIARALASSPKMLVADEPITMLDASQRLNILSILIELKRKRNITVLLITHDLASASVMSERTMVMYVGKLVEFGPTKRVLSKPHHPYTELILTATPRLRGRNVDTAGDEGNIEQSEGMTQGCVFVPRCKYSSGVCRDAEPPLEEKSSVHFAACHNPLNTGGGAKSDQE